MIPGLENAQFLRYGSMHRNIYINSPAMLNSDMSLKSQPNIYFAGQIAGSEGYTEAIASGLYVAQVILKKTGNYETLSLKPLSPLKAMIDYITNPENEKKFQPIHINWGLIKSQMPKELYKNKEAMIKKIQDQY